MTKARRIVSAQRAEHDCIEPSLRGLFHHFRWKSGLCQIWDNSTPWKPIPSDYKAGRIQFKTNEAAIAARGQLIAP